METITLTIMVVGLLAVFFMDTIQKRRDFIAKNRSDQ